MKICIEGKMEDVLYVVEKLMCSDEDLPLTMIIHRGISEVFCVQIVTGTSLDVIAKIKDLAF